MEGAGIQLVAHGTIENKFFGEDCSNLDARNIIKLVNCYGKKMEHEINRIGDMISNFVFELEFEEEMSEKQFYENVENFTLKIGEQKIWEISGNYFWRNCCIKQHKISEMRKKWFLVVKMKELILGDFISSNFNLIACILYPVTVSLQLKKNAEIEFYVDYLFYTMELRKKIWKENQNLQIIIPKIITKEIKNGKIILPSVKNLFANCFWIKLPQPFANITINGEPFIQDHFGDGLYWVQWKDEYANKEMHIPLEGTITLFFDEVKKSSIINGEFIISI